MPLCSAPFRTILPTPRGEREPSGLERAGAVLCAAPACRAPARERPREICAEIWFVCAAGHLNARGLNEWKEAS